MKKIFVLAAFCITALFANAGIHGDSDYHYKYSDERVIEKSFEVEALPNLEMQGKYSDFIITAWDEPKIDFKVKITVKSDKESTVKTLMSIIDVELSQQGNTVKAKTVFTDKTNRSFNASMSIKYYVKVPKDVLMDLETKYGDITIDEVREKLKATVKYGDFKADNILIDDKSKNDVEVKYGNIIIDNVNSISVVLTYGDAKINKCKNIDGTITYSKIYISELNTGKLDNKYSTTRIESADDLDFGNTAYSDLKIKKVTNSIEACLKYSDLSVSVTSQTPKVTIDGAYSDAKVRLNPDAMFDYNLHSSYGDISFKGFFDAESIKGVGHFGEGERGLLDITVKYGDVDISKIK